MHLNWELPIAFGKAWTPHLNAEQLRSLIDKGKTKMVLPEMAEVWQSTLGWQPDERQQSQFQQLYELILEGNRQLNLTRITAPEEFWEKHLWDSLRGIAPLLQSVDASTQPAASLQMIDIGTGAGFPGIPVAIVQPASVTLLDSTHKKMVFLEKVLTQLGIQNATPLTGRSEEVGQHSQHRENYDVALIRAVGSASVCAEYALPLLKLEGLAVLYRGQWTAEETEGLQKAVRHLGGVIESVEAFTTPLSHSLRHCLYLRKVALTPAEFPRAVGVPAQKPL